MVAVIIPEKLSGPLLREPVVKPSVRMEPFGIERASHLIRDKLLRIKTQLRAAGAGKVGAQMQGEPVNRRKRNVKKTVAGFVRIGRKLLDQPWDVRACLNARAVLTGSDADIADQDLREDIVVVVSNFHSKLSIGLKNRRHAEAAIVLQVRLLELIVTAFPN